MILCKVMKELGKTKLYFLIEEKLRKRALRLKKMRQAARRQRERAKLATKARKKAKRDSVTALVAQIRAKNGLGRPKAVKPKVELLPTQNHILTDKS